MLQIQRKKLAFWNDPNLYKMLNLGHYVFKKRNFLDWPNFVQNAQSRAILLQKDVNEKEVLWVDKKNRQRCAKKGCFCRRNPCRCKLCGRVFCKQHIGFHYKVQEKYRWMRLYSIVYWYLLPWFITLPLTYLETKLINGKVASIIIWISKNVISVHYFLPNIFKKWFFSSFTLLRLQICVFLTCILLRKKFHVI